MGVRIYRPRYENLLINWPILFTAIGFIIAAIHRLLNGEHDLVVVLFIASMMLLALYWLRVNKHRDNRAINECLDSAQQIDYARIGIPIKPQMKDAEIRRLLKESGKDEAPICSIYNKDDLDKYIDKLFEQDIVFADKNDYVDYNAYAEFLYLLACKALGEHQLSLSREKEGD